MYLGIDLGTTNSTAAVFDGEQVTFVRSAQGSALTPSVVRIDSRGQVTVGAKARRMLETDPDNTRGEFKRLMGTQQRIEFPAAKVSRLPQELSAEVLKALRADVQEQLGFSPTRAVIAVPALFELPQCTATSEAARLAGFERVELIQEPVASALAAGWSAEGSTGCWMVYDLGGGTFDASLLESRDGLLRVIGHDGDNFLGGRDLDWAIVDWVVQQLGERARSISRADARFASSFRKLKLAVEEAKIELTRQAQTNLCVPAAFVVDGESIDLDLTLERGQVAELCRPLVDRSIQVCRRLIHSQGLEVSQLSRMVLVGGPTVMPSLRERLSQVLGTPFGERLDPMTLVAHGAALYAATAGLSAKNAAANDEPGRRVWIQHPAMTSDLSPHVVGRLVEGEPTDVSFVRIQRSDGQWQSADVPLDGERAFVTTVQLLPRRPNEFTLEGRGPDGGRVPLQPSRFTIVQGMTISDPPLARTIGVALADDRVHIYFERGAPLPARRTFRHYTVETVLKGSPGAALKIPIVQGELEQAHLCRLVGSLEIRGEELKNTLPAGTLVEVTLELDRGGRLSAKAQVPSTSDLFEQIAQLMAPDASPETLAKAITEVEERLIRVRTEAFRRGSALGIERLGQAERTLGELRVDADAAKGGDADAGQRAQRALVELDALLDTAESESRWPEVENKALEHLTWASRWVGSHGTSTEQQMFEEVAKSAERARKGKEPVELQRQLRLAKNIANGAFFRHPMAWSWCFDDAASQCDSATDLPLAKKLVEQGTQARDTGKVDELRNVVERLWLLLPANVQSRRLSHDSGVR